MADLWNIHLEPWIIADGNYDHFIRGQTAEFALQFWSKCLRPALSRGRNCQAQGDQYEVTAKVITSASDVCVIDFGLQAYRPETAPISSRVWKHVSGRIGLGIDQYDYFEFLYKRPEIPPLIYSWEIKAITMGSAPYILAKNNKLWIIDESRQQEQDVESTNCPRPPDFKYIKEGNSLHATHCIWFILRCALLDVPPKRHSVTAK